MKAKLVDHRRGIERVIDTQFLTLGEWMKFNFSTWGFYKLKKVAPDHFIVVHSETKQPWYELKGV